jgi:thiol:disulfide interchange protein
MARLPTALVAAASLLLGFAVADVTGVRALGGVVLLAAAAWLYLRWREQAGPAAAAGLLATYGVLFAVSHLLGRAIGAWPAVIVVAVAAGAAAWVVADARRPTPGTAG